MAEVTKTKSGFYNTAAWAQKRKHIMARDKYTDQLELRAGRHVPATLVHHILPREKYPEYQLEDWNLISISKETHMALHDPYGQLTNAGKELMLRTAHAQGIKLSKVTLIIGLPGTGKTSLAKQMLEQGEGLVYDLDHIASAFTLKKPNHYPTEAAQKLANSMVVAFAQRARDYSSKVIIIRTAPTLKEFEGIEPDEVIICAKTYNSMRQRGMDLDEYKNRLIEIKGYAEANGIPVTVRG